MVRFGAALQHSRTRVQTCFNSSMVRFGENIDYIDSEVIEVSIPVWCDLESASYKLSLRWFVGFNSSMVRFGGTLSSASSALLACFNSSMVRFGVKTGITSDEPIFVSIPVWCDLELI